MPESKKILVINYSQSGQLHEIIEDFMKPFEEFDVDRVIVEPKNKFEFPWKTSKFYDAMPESVLEIPAEIEPIEYKHDKYHLIIFGYQPWFLSPSIPANSILHNEAFKEKLKGTDVITIIGARNMWLNSQTAIIKQIKDAGGNLVGNIPLADRSSNLLSAVAILHWMSTGKKTKKWGIFPKPGVSDEDIAFTHRYGEITVKKLNESSLKGLQDEFINLGKFNISTTVYFIEGRAKKLFLIWANKIIKKEKPAVRKRWLVGFRCYLVFALFIVSPIVITIYSILIRPFTQNRIKAGKKHFYYSGVESIKN